MSNKLKPCPFCGATSVSVWQLSDIPPYPDIPMNWVAGCVACDITIGHFNTEAEAAEAWNRRAAPINDQDAAALATRIVNRFLAAALGSQSIPLEWLRLGPIIIEELNQAAIGDTRAPAGRCERPQDDDLNRQVNYDLSLDFGFDDDDPVDGWPERYNYDENPFADTAPDEVAEAVPPLDLGLCCACLKNPATGFAFLPFRAPVPGTGWGCLQCGLSQDGAIAVLCETCGEAGADPVEVCYGQPGDRQRTVVGELEASPFEHDYSKHPEYEYPGPGLVMSRFDDAPTAPPPDDSELLRLMVESFEGAPPVELEMTAFEAFNLVGLMQLCLRLDLPPNVKATALTLARRFEGKVNEAAPGMEEMMGLGYDERHDRDADGRPIREL